MKSFRIATVATICLTAVSIAAIVNFALAQSARMGGRPAVDHHQVHGDPAPAKQRPMAGKSAIRASWYPLPAPMQEHMLANMRDHLANS